MKKGFLQNKKTNKQRREEMKMREEERTRGVPETTPAGSSNDGIGTIYHEKSGSKVCANSWAPTTKLKTLESIAKHGIFEATAPTPGLTEKVTVTRRVLIMKFKVGRRKHEYRGIEIFLVVPPTRWIRMQRELLERILPHTMVIAFATKKTKDMTGYSTADRLTSYMTTAALEILAALNDSKPTVTVVCGID